MRRRVPGKSNAQRPAIAASLVEPTEVERSGATPEAWHWQPHHHQSRADLWQAMLLEADVESVRQGSHMSFMARIHRLEKALRELCSRHTILHTRTAQS